MIWSAKHITLNRLAKLGVKNDVSTLQKQLTELACPYTITIGLRTYLVPITVNDLRDNICWGQRLLMATPHTNDFESILYFVCNYYQPIVTRSPFDENKVNRLYKKIARVNVVDLYPVLVRLVTLFTEMVEIEAQKLNSEPSKEMRAAEVDRLKPFSDLNILEMISNKCKVPLSEAHLQEYNVVFALLWCEKETADFNQRFYQIQIANK
jgi:hypothetical protein